MAVPLSSSLMFCLLDPVGAAELPSDGSGRVSLLAAVVGQNPTCLLEH